MIERDRGELHSRDLAVQMANFTDRVVDTYKNGPVFGVEPIIDAYDLATLEIKIADDLRGFIFDEDGTDVYLLRRNQWQTALVLSYTDSWDMLWQLIRNKGEAYVEGHLEEKDDWDTVGRSFLNLAKSL